jgi:hypothetical protein
VTIRLVSDWQEIYKRSIDALTDSRPVFYGRIGGSDTDMIIDYLEGRMAGEKQSRLLARVLPHYERLTEYNGYYDKANNKKNLIKFCKLVLACYGSSTHASLGGKKWQTLYFKSNMPSRHYVDVGVKSRVYDHLLEIISNGDKELCLYPFRFVEKTTKHKWSMFNAFREILRGKRVLVVSPFSRSIEINFKNRGYFFRNYDYPEFSLITYTTPITYKGLPDDYYPHQDWFHTADSMKTEVARIEFDIALLGCGSYALPLGAHICDVMGRKAIYVGGLLQLYFGIMGRRYADEFFTDQINAEYFITAEEAGRYKSHVTITPQAPKEGFGAYF